MIDVTFSVPIIPEGAPRPRTALIPGKGGGKPQARIYVPKSAQDWKKQVALAAEPHMPDGRIDEALRVDVLFLLPRPQRLLRKRDPDGPVWHCAKPDRDNLDKNVLDALAPFWRDDTDVCVGTLVKAYHAKDGRPEVRVRIRSASLFDPQQVAEALGLLSPRASASPLPASQEGLPLFDDAADSWQDLGLGEAP